MHVMRRFTHRCAAWDLVKSLEKEAAFYSDVLKGIQQSPPAEQWAALTERYQHLQQQVHQQQEQAVKASDLEQTLSASLQPCQVCYAVPCFGFCSRWWNCFDGNRHFCACQHIVFARPVKPLCSKPWAGRAAPQSLQHPGMSWLPPSNACVTQLLV